MIPQYWFNKTKQHTHTLAHRWCTIIGGPGSAQPEGIPAMDIELKSIHMYTQKREIEEVESVY